MARIYMNCGPCIQSKGSSMYTVFRWIALIVIVMVALFLLVPVPKAVRFSMATLDTIRQGSDIQYAIVIDCGSSGSRVYVYFWSPHSGNPSDLLDIQQLHDHVGEPVVKKVSPGLSEFGKNPNGASDHIKELLLFTQQYIPVEKHSQTLLHVMATAGMRMLPEVQQQAILLDLRRDIKKEFSFIAPENHYEVITGKQEGVYAWIAINSALGRFNHVTDVASEVVKTIEVPHTLPGHTSGSHWRKKTVGMLDMGGGSVQIAFEVTNQTQVKEIPNSLLSEFNLGCRESDAEHTYSVYVTTFLGFGANSARDRYEEALVAQAVKTGLSALDESQPLADACLPSGMVYKSSDNGKAMHYYKGSGNIAGCKIALDPLVNKSVPCTKSPCSVNGIHQPRIDPNTEFYGFSEFWYSMEDVFKMGGQYNYQKFENAAEKFCGTPWTTLQRLYDQKMYPKADEDRFNFQCFKSAWILEMLHSGFSFPLDYDNLISAQLVNGKDAGWALGAIIYKTRFLPLRNVEYENMHSNSLAPWQRLLHLPDLHFILFVCLLVVLTAIVVYMKWLRCCPKTSDLSRVPSMSYFVTDVNQMEQGTTYVKGQGFTL